MSNHKHQLNETDLVDLNGKRMSINSSWFFQQLINCLINWNSFYFLGFNRMFIFLFLYTISRCSIQSFPTLIYKKQKFIDNSIQSIIDLLVDFDKDVDESTKTSSSSFIRLFSFVRSFNVRFLLNDIWKMKTFLNDSLLVYLLFLSSPSHIQIKYDKDTNSFLEKKRHWRNKFRLERRKKKIH